MATSLSVIIPTYNRGEVLLATLAMLQAQSISPDQIIIVDQTAYASEDPLAHQLQAMHDDGNIQWIRKAEPSIPKAMNTGLRFAKTDWVLFLDDDVEVEPNFIEKHLGVISEGAHLAHVGQIVQPWQSANEAVGNRVEQKQIDALAPSTQPSHGNIELRRDLDFRFNSSAATYMQNCMAGNLCVNRDAALHAGGFDEQFFGVAYRFETEFCKRFCEIHNTAFLYSPIPWLRHLHIRQGGTRAHADFLTSAKPVHSMGDYYYALRVGHGFARLHYIAERLVRSVIAKFYLTKPWFIPVRLVAECRGLTAAIRATKQGPMLIDAEWSQQERA